MPPLALNKHYPGEDIFTIKKMNLMFALWIRLAFTGDNKTTMWSTIVNVSGKKGRLIISALTCRNILNLIDYNETNTVRVDTRLSSN